MPRDLSAAAGGVTDRGRADADDVAATGGRRGARRDRCRRSRPQNRVAYRTSVWPSPHRHRRCRSTTYKTRAQHRATPRRHTNAPDAGEPSRTTADIVAAAAIRAPSGGNAQPWRIETTPGFGHHPACAGAHVHDGRRRFAAARWPSARRCSTPGWPLPLTVSSDPSSSTMETRVPAAGRRPTDPRRRRRTGTAVPADAAAGDQPPSRNARAAHQSIDASLESAARREGARLHLLTSRDEIDKRRSDSCGRGPDPLSDPSTARGDVLELRWPGEASLDTGIDVRSLELEPGRYGDLGHSSAPDVMAQLAQWDAGAALGEDTYDRGSARAPQLGSVLCLAAH